MRRIVFSLQNKKKQVLHDFSFALQQAAAFKLAIGGQVSYRLVYPKTITKYDEHVIPVGSIEFVTEYIGQKLPWCDRIVPIPICGYYGTQNTFFNHVDTRFMCIIKGESNDKDKKERQLLAIQNNPATRFFIKSVSKLKDIPVIHDKVTLLKYLTSSNATKDDLFISEYIDIVSEHRAFVFCGALQDVRQYSGDLFSLPDKDFVLKTIRTFSTSLTSAAEGAFTFDFAIDAGGRTHLLEVHPFVSCGLYGFSNYIVLPSMTIRGYRWMYNYIVSNKL